MGGTSSNKITMAKVFKDLTVLEQILDDLNQGKRIVVKKNDITYSAISRAVNTTRNKLFAAFQMAKANRDTALPESKITAKSARERTLRREKQENILNALEAYFNEL